jgi:transposase
MVKCADTVGAATSGYHGGKKVKGRGRHLVVDTEGWPLALAVAAASVSDKAGARLVTARLIALLTTLQLMWADAGYNGGPLRDWMRTTAGVTLEIVARTSPHSFQVLKRRWVVERTFGWLMRYRRLARDYERTIEHHEAMVWWATVFIMTKRLTRYETGQPQPQRWGGERPRPPQQAALSTGSKTPVKSPSQQPGIPNGRRPPFPGKI